MAGQRFEGRSLEDALATAADAFGVKPFQIDYHIVVEKRGFLGGLKRIVIEAEANPDKQPELPLAQQPAPRMAASESRPRRARGEERGGRPRRDAERPRGPRRREEIEEIEEAPPQGERSEQAERVASWCGELFLLAHLDLEIRTIDREDAVEVHLYGPDAARLTDREGELLESLQVLANKSLSDKIEKKVDLDARGFRARHAAGLEARAREAAARVLASGEEELLPAMSPGDRRIVHLALHDTGGVQTISRGEGFFKRVAIVPGEGPPAGDAEP
ncbi:MAG: protein jag [Thermoanaerobaculia bacterium]